MAKKRMPEDGESAAPLKARHPETPVNSRSEIVEGIRLPGFPDHATQRFAHKNWMQIPSFD